MTRARHALVLLAVVLASTGCASMHYSQTKVGTLKGKLIVQWIDHDKFIFIPDERTPLSFTRHDRTVITPGRMYTDGGSIPRPLWALRSYSPWGYAPAYIVHDWLFFMNYCKLAGHEKYNVHEAAQVLSEVMKTMMEQEGANKLVLYSVYEAVDSPLAENLWNTGKCVTPEPSEAARPKIEYTIEVK